MTFVTHHAAHGETARTGQVGQSSRVWRSAATAGEADVHIDQDFAHSAGCGRSDRLFGVDRESDPGAGLNESPEAPSIQHLVCEQEVLSKPCGSHALALTDRCAGERAVPGLSLSERERRALVSLHMRSEPFAGKGFGHGRQVVLQRAWIDDERWGR